MSAAGMLLLDWCYSAPIGQRVPAIAPAYAADTAPEIAGRQPVTPATDLFMAARCLLHLLGGQNNPDALAVWLGRLQSFSLVQSSGRTQGTRYFIDPSLLRGSELKVPTTLLRIEPHRLLELVREDLRRYPNSKIGEISQRIGQEVNRSQLKRALAELVSLAAVVMDGQRNGARYRLAAKK